jgi:hypothetical protein
MGQARRDGDAPAEPCCSVFSCNRSHKWYTRPPAGGTYHTGVATKGANRAAGLSLHPTTVTRSPGRVVDDALQLVFHFLPDFQGTFDKADGEVLILDALHIIAEGFLPEAINVALAKLSFLRRWRFGRLLCS